MFYVVRSKYVDKLPKNRIKKLRNFQAIFTSNVCKLPREQILDRNYLLCNNSDNKSVVTVFVCFKNEK